MIRPDQRAETGGVNVGGDARDITIGYTIEQHEASLERRETRVRSDLERAHAAERALLNRELDEIRRQLADLEGSFEARRDELETARTALAQLSGTLPEERLQKAYAALGDGETAAADALFAQVEAMASATIERAATAAFERGKLAEADIRWGDAAGHYSTAARLAPVFRHLLKARECAWRSGDYPAALRFGEDLVTAAVADCGAGSLEHATALNEHALTLNAAGRHEEAEGLYQQAIEFGGRIEGLGAGEQASWLNNLAGVLRATGRYYEAEAIYRDSLARTAAAMGADHPAYATRLGNLATVLRSTARFTEAEALYRQALAIDARALGTAHPDYAIDLNNLAGLLCAVGRWEEAEPMYVEAMAIDGRVLGTRHPLYAVDLNNYAKLLVAVGRDVEAEPLYRQALEITERALGASHPDRAQMLYNYAGLVETTERKAEAERLYREAIALRQQSPSADSADAVSYLRKLADSALLDGAQRRGGADLPPGIRVGGGDDGARPSALSRGPRRRGGLSPRRGAAGGGRAAAPPSPGSQRASARPGEPQLRPPSRATCPDARFGRAPGRSRGVAAGGPRDPPRNAWLGTAPGGRQTTGSTLPPGRRTSTLSMRRPSRSTTSKHQPCAVTLSPGVGMWPSSSMTMPASVAKSSVRMSSMPRTRAAASIGRLPSSSHEPSSRSTAPAGSSSPWSGRSPAMLVRMSVGITSPSRLPYSSTTSARWMPEVRKSSIILSAGMLSQT